MVHEKTAHKKYNVELKYKIKTCIVDGDDVGYYIINEKKQHKQTLTVRARTRKKRCERTNVEKSVYLEKSAGKYTTQ